MKRPAALLTTTNEEDQDEPTPTERAAEWLTRFREDTVLDFALFENSITRVQLLRNQNQAERSRYADENTSINDRAQTVRDNISSLRQQLQDAQDRLALRKQYDVLAEKITNNRMLKPREDQDAAMEKLQKEIADLEREKEEYGRTWQHWGNQFGMIVKEGNNMLALIKNVKEEAERKEGMDGGGDADGEEVSTKGQLSAVASPKPDTEGTTPLLSQDVETDDVAKGKEDTENEDVKMGDANDGDEDTNDAIGPELEEGEAEEGEAEDEEMS